MGWFRKKREPVSMSDMFAETLSFTFKEVNTRFIDSYWPSVGDEIGEQISQNKEAYISLLIKYFLTDLLKSRRLKVTGIASESIDIEAAWRKGLEQALQNRSRDAESYNKKLRKCIAAVEDYSLAYENHRSDPMGPPTDIYFSACRHFTDLVVDANSRDNMLVFSVAKDIFEVAKATCVATPKLFELNST